MITAFHNPKNYPEKPLEIYKPKDKEVKVQSEQEQDMLITIMQNSIKNKKNT